MCSKSYGYSAFPPSKITKSCLLLKHLSNVLEVKKRKVKKNLSEYSCLRFSWILKLFYCKIRISDVLFIANNYFDSIL